MSEERQLRVELPGGRSVSAIATGPEPAAEFTFIYAPGAGSNVNDPSGRFLCRDLASPGVRAVRFQFLYQEAGKRAPDRPAVV
ncbi:MAG: hypothetical protein WD904_06230 [Dehalococcoidia bacterium]